MIAPVRTRGAFTALSRSPIRSRSGPVWVTRAPLPDGEDPTVRVAYAIGRAVGTAVVRNRLRRRLRAIVDRLDDGGLQPGLYLIGVRPGAATLSFAALDRALSTAMAQLGRP